MQSLKTKKMKRRPSNKLRMMTIYPKKKSLVFPKRKKRKTKSLTLTVLRRRLRTLKTSGSCSPEVVVPDGEFWLVCLRLHTLDG